MARVEKISLRTFRCTAVISDIHGKLSYLRGLLERLALTEEDALIFLGDMVEKGPESLATLRYIMALREQCNVFALLGNCDGWHAAFDVPGEEAMAGVLHYMLHPKPGHFPGLVWEMCREAGIEVRADMDLAHMRRVLSGRFAEELAFLRSLPHILESEDYVFVHGGLPPEGVDWQEASGWKCMKYDYFADGSRRFDKWVICGHTPVMLYRRDITVASPRIDADCRIVSIDGGCVLKDDGQLNALLIEDGHFDAVWYDPFPLIRALSHQTESEGSRYVPWGDNEIELLAAEGDFRLVRQKSSGYELWVPEDFLFERFGKLLVNDCTDYRPAVEPGDILALVRQTERGAWIKKNGVSGWYDGEYERV